MEVLHYLLIRFILFNVMGTDSSITPGVRAQNALNWIVQIAKLSHGSVPPPTNPKQSHSLSLVKTLICCLSRSASTAAQETAADSPNKTTKTNLLTALTNGKPLRHL